LVSVPNIKSATYPANFNAYQQAVRERTRAIEEAQAKLQQRAEGTTIADAMLAVARAEVARLEAELKKYVLRAPFDGTVTRLDIEVGDTASQGVSAVTVMSAGELEIESFVPEIQISYLEVGDTATVTLEAYGESVVFPAHVVAIDPAETVRDGVSTYRVILHFDQEDERVKSGMTANIVITTDQREGVISIPQGAVTKKNGTSYVTVRTDTADERRAVITGPVSSLGMVEILEGLSIGEVVVLP
jgi:HlyD family secretion protein